jgi:hypothetical protein
VRLRKYWLRHRGERGKGVIDGNGERVLSTIDFAIVKRVSFQCTFGNGIVRKKLLVSATISLIILSGILESLGELSLKGLSERI